MSYKKNIVTYSPLALEYEIGGETFCYKPTIVLGLFSAEVDSAFAAAFRQGAYVRVTDHRHGFVFNMDIIGQRGALKVCGDWASEASRLVSKG